MMDQKKFDVLIRKLELEADRQPRLYKFKVFLLASIGYGYIFFILLILIVLNSLFILYPSSSIVNFGIPVIFLTFITVRALWVHFPPPEGSIISPSQAKILFQLLEDIRKQLKGPKIHTVLLNSEFNASIVQNPRFGIFGVPKNYLIIGLPLMQALSAPQFTAVLAHEYGHLSGEHNRFNAWIYRIRKTWSQIVESLEKRNSLGMLLFYRFFEWYIPFFSAYSFVLARLSEFESDRSSAQFIGSHYAAQALISVSIKSQFLDEIFWHKLYAEADNCENPPYKPFSALPIAFCVGISSYHSKQWLKKSLEKYTSTEDTHPCLTERLESLGEKPKIPDCVKETAAQYLFGQHYVEVVRKMNRAWIKEVKTEWKTRFQYVQSAKSKLHYLQNKAEKAVLSLDEIWQQALLTEEFQGVEAAFPLYQAIIENHPHHTSANYAVGRILLERNDEKGIVFIEKAMDNEGNSIISGCELISRFLVNQSRLTEAQSYEDRVLKRRILEQSAKIERKSLDQEKDNFIEHALSEEQCKKIVTQLTLHSEIKRAYLARKVVQYLPENPVYILGIVRNFKWYPDKINFSHRLSSTLDMPGNFFVVEFNFSFKKLQKKIRKINNTLIYERLKK